MMQKVRVRSRGGFTLIELMIVVAIVGVLAAIAIPAYLDYTKRAKMSEVLAAMDAIAQGATEYHASLASFPDETYTAQNLANFSQEFATITIHNGTNSFENMRITANFNATLCLRKSGGGCGQLDMIVSYSTATGYGKRWDLSSSTIDAIYFPKGGGT
jgi:prepilin-type N-terminal cleavage/methylation domain-containing protein